MKLSNAQSRRRLLVRSVGTLLTPAALMGATSAPALAFSVNRAAGTLVSRPSGESDIHLANFNSGTIDPRLALPTPRRTRNVSNSSQLADAMRTAQPGDHIVLDNGTYQGPGNFSPDGTSSAPIVVRSRNLLGAQITGGRISVAGDYQILYGLDFVKTRHDITSGAVAGRIWRCRFRDKPAPSTDTALTVSSSRNADIAHCEFVNWAGRGISVRVNGGARGFTIRRCLFRNAPNQRSSGGGQKNSTEAIQVGVGTSDAPINAGGRIEFNRFVRWSSDDEVISNKSSGNVYFRNSFDNCNGNVTNRRGRNNRYEANEFRNTRGAWDLDGNNLWLGNKHSGSATGGLRDWWVMTGNVRAGNYSNSGDRNASEGSTFAGNDLVGRLRVGHNVSWTPKSVHPARDTRVREHQGAVDLVAGWNVNTDSRPSTNETSRSWAQPRWLTDGDVGPNGSGLASPPSSGSSNPPPAEPSNPPSGGGDVANPSPEPGDSSPPTFAERLAALFGSSGGGSSGGGSSGGGSSPSFPFLRLFSRN